MTAPARVWVREWPNGARSVYDEPTEGAVEYIRRLGKNEAASSFGHVADPVPFGGVGGRERSSLCGPMGAVAKGEAMAPAASNEVEETEAWCGCPACQFLRGERATMPADTVCPRLGDVSNLRAG